MKQSEKIATHVTVGTEQDGDSGRSCANDEYVAKGQQHVLNQEISRLTAENQQFRNVGSPRLGEIAVQTAISSENPRQKAALESSGTQGSWTTSNVQR